MYFGVIIQSKYCLNYLFLVLVLDLNLSVGSLDRISYGPKQSVFCLGKIDDFLVK